MCTFMARKDPTLGFGTYSLCKAFYLFSQAFVWLIWWLFRWVLIKSVMLLRLRLRNWGPSWPENSSQAQNDHLYGWVLCDVYHYCVCQTTFRLKNCVVSQKGRARKNTGSGSGDLLSCHGAAASMSCCHLVCKETRGPSSPPVYSWTKTHPLI